MKIAKFLMKYSGFLIKLSVYSTHFLNFFLIKISAFQEVLKNSVLVKFSHFSTRGFALFLMLITLLFFNLSLPETTFCEPSPAEFWVKTRCSDTPMYPKTADEYLLKCLVDGKKKPSRCYTESLSVHNLELFLENDKKLIYKWHQNLVPTFKNKSEARIFLSIAESIKYTEKGEKEILDQEILVRLYQVLDSEDPFRTPLLQAILKFYNVDPMYGMDSIIKQVAERGLCKAFLKELYTKVANNEAQKTKEFYRLAIFLKDTTSIGKFYFLGLSE